MRVFKRNAVIFAVLLFVCAAVYLNWSYNRDESETVQETGSANSESDTGDTDGSGEMGNPDDSDESAAGLYYEGDAEVLSDDNSADSSYFDSTRLSREKARDEATETLLLITEDAGATPELADETLAKISAMAENSVTEAEIEALIMAKGFSDCVTYISEDGIKVIVPAPLEGLSTTDVARIRDIVTSETNFAADAITIIEIN